MVYSYWRRLHMKKKFMICFGLSLASTGLVLAGRHLVKHLKKRNVKKDREKLESYVNKYLHGNEQLMEFIGTLSDSQVKELIEIIESNEREQNQLKLKSPIIPKILEKKVTNLIG